MSFIQDGVRKCRVFKGKTGFVKRLAPKVCKEKNHVFVDRIDKSVPRVTVWHHSAEPRGAKH